MLREARRDTGALGSSLPFTADDRRERARHCLRMAQAMADATHCRRPSTAEIMRRSGKAKPVAGVVQRADLLTGPIYPRTGLQNITFPSHADNFRHALLFHRAGPAPMISRPQRLRQTAADLEDKAPAMRGHPLRRRTEIEWLTRAGRFDVGGIGNIATPCSVGAKWRFHLADSACDEKQDAFWSKQPSRGRSNTKVRWIGLAASSH
jgi:hypothetical protein